MAIRNMQITLGQLLLWKYRTRGLIAIPVGAVVSLRSVVTGRVIEEMTVIARAALKEEVVVVLEGRKIGEATVIVKETPEAHTVIVMTEGGVRTQTTIFHSS